MKITSSNNYKPSFGARIILNRTLKSFVREMTQNKRREQLKQALGEIKKIGTHSDTIELTQPTWVIREAQDGSIKKEPVTFVLYNGKNAGHFENRHMIDFIENFQSRGYIPKAERCKPSLEAKTLKSQIKPEPFFKKVARRFYKMFRH